MMEYQVKQLASLDDPIVDLVLRYYDSVSPYVRNGIKPLLDYLVSNTLRYNYKTIIDPSVDVALLAKANELVSLVAAKVNILQVYLYQVNQQYVTIRATNGSICAQVEVSVDFIFHSSDSAQFVGYVARELVDAYTVQRYLK